MVSVTAAHTIFRQKCTVSISALFIPQYIGHKFRAQKMPTVTQNANAADDATEKDSQSHHHIRTIVGQRSPARRSGVRHYHRRRHFDY